MNKIIGLISIFIILNSCDRPFYGLKSPLVVYSNGVWKLEKTVGPTKTINAKDLGYEKLIQFQSDGSRTNVYIFKDKKLEEYYTFGGTTNEIVKKERIYFEVSVGAKILKIELNQEPNGSNAAFSLILSDFLYKTSQVDTVRYHYSYYSPTKNW